MGQGQKKSIKGTSPESIEYNEKIKQALELRRLGATFDEISSQIGLTPNAVRKAVAKLLQKAVSAKVDDLRNLWFIRLEKLIAVLIDKAEKGNLLAVDRIDKICDRQAKLFNLYAPVKIQIQAAPEVEAAQALYQTFIESGMSEKVALKKVIEGAKTNGFDLSADDILDADTIG